MGEILDYGVPPTDKLLQFYNCRILRNSQIIRDDLWVRNAKIVNPEPIFYDEKVTADFKIDCHDYLIVPGFIDLQINGGFGHDFSSPEKSITESIEAVSRGLVQHGVTSFCPTIISSSPEMYHKIIPKIKPRNGGKWGAEILGVHAEGPFINAEKIGAHPIQHILSFDKGVEIVQETYGSLKNISIITLAPELDPRGSVIKYLVELGVVVSLGHSTCNLAESEKAASQGATFITHLFNAMLPFHHRDPGLIGLLASRNIPKNKKVFYGIIADGVHTDPAALRIAYSTDPKGLVLVTDAISAMGLKSGTYNLGDQNVTVDDERAVVTGTDTLCGSIATMITCIKKLIEATDCTIVKAVECATLHPAQVLGITSKKGTLDYGSDADFVMLDQCINVQATYINGERVWIKKADL